MGHIRSLQFLGNLLDLYAQGKKRYYSIAWPTIVQRLKLQNVCNRVRKKIPDMCFASVFLTFLRAEIKTFRQARRRATNRAGQRARHGQGHGEGSTGQAIVEGKAVAGRDG